MMIQLLRLAAIPWFVVPLATASAQDRFFNSGGVRIRYIEQGLGEPVVLIHGFTANIELNWMETGILQNLAKGYRVIALDCRGHGKSDKPHNPSAYGATMGKDVIGLLDHLGIQRAHIIGYSMGSRIIGHLLTTDSDRFRTATLGASPPRRNWSAEDERQSRAAADFYEKSDSTVLTSSQYEGRVSEEQIRARQRYFDGKALAACQRSRGQQAVTDEQLRAVTVPILALVGTADRRLEGMRDLKEVIPNLKLVELEGANHINACINPKFIKEIRLFIASHSDR